MATTVDSQEQASVAELATVDVELAAGVQLRQIPLSRIVVREGFNPRGQVADDRELEELAETIRQSGCVQPVRVRANGHGDYELIAGERRYLAAVKAALIEIPAIIRPAGVGAEDEEADLLVEALIENDQRSPLNPLARARGYGRLLDMGLTVKGVALRVRGSSKPAAIKQVRDYLRILKLPPELQEKVADAVIPMRAVKALAELEAIHAGLSTLAADEVLRPGDDYRPFSWEDVEHTPLQVVIGADSHPEGVYVTNVSYAVETFALSDDARKDLATLEQLLGRTITHVALQGAEVEQARALGALYAEGWRSIVVGVEVASQLVGDYLARAVKEQRRRQRGERKRARELAAAVNSAGPDGSADDASEPVVAQTAEQRQQAAEQAKRDQREAERVAREKATAFNLELGRGAYAKLARVRVDERVLKVLASVNITGELGNVALRGARYCLPSWVTESTQRNGKAKYEYLERADAEQRAVAFLAGAEKAGEIVGRQLVLLALAVYANQDAVAFSGRCWHNVVAKGPWAEEFDELLDQLVADNLPDATMATLKPLLDERQQQREQRAAAIKAGQEAAERLEGIEERIDALTAEQLERAEQDADIAWTSWTPRYGQLRQRFATRRQQLADAQAAEPSAGEDVAEQIAA